MLLFKKLKSNKWFRRTGEDGGGKSEFHYYRANETWYFLIDTDLFTRTMELIITCMSKVLVSKCIHNEKKGKHDHLERHWKFCEAWSAAKQA
jgi:hypothetical protein